MKKLLVILAGIVFLMGINSCNSCTNNKLASSASNGLVVENVISLDRQAMYMNHANDYRWYETGVKLKNWLDEENDGSIEMIVNVFQVVEQCSETTYDTFVYKYQHFADGTVNEDSIHGFWVEDWPLEQEAIKITFEQAFQKLMEANLPKPHSRMAVLRKEVGPCEANPQWIFGNLHETVYVDAVTGEVRNSSPSFEGLNLGTPLGEWP